MPYVPTIYISGPMTGYADWNFPAFNAAASLLRSKGFGVINPADFGVQDGEEWADCLRRDLGVILSLRNDDMVCTLTGWAGSKGASLEVALAQGLGLKVVALYEILEATAK